jgi:hypothetical protein
MLNKKYPEILIKNTRKLLLYIFVISLIIRLLLIFTNRTKNGFPDLNIYRETGQLVRTGINIYDYEDGKSIRNDLRIDSKAFDASQDQDAWNYYTSSNLPMSSLHYGLIDKITNNKPVLYRIIFSLFDCILSVFVAFFIIRYWKLRNTWYDLIMIAGAAALSPALLLWGSIIPEDKGLQILFMIIAVLLAKEKKWILSAIFLGTSIAYKGLGVFIYPLCIWLIAGEPQNIFRMNGLEFRKIVLYSLISLFFTVIWFIPYMPEVFEMMKSRMTSNIDTEPGHGSIWVFAFSKFPESWMSIKSGFILVSSLLWFYTFVIRKLNPAAISLFLLVLFVDVMLLQGSLDRMNIGIIASAVLFSFVDLKYCRILVWYTIAVGWLLLIKYVIHGTPNEMVDAAFSAGYVLLFSVYPLYYLFNAGILKDHTKVDINQ